LLLVPGESKSTRLIHLVSSPLLRALETDSPPAFTRSNASAASVPPRGPPAHEHHLPEITLKNPTMALIWNPQAAAMPTGVFTRSVGMRLAIVGTAHLQVRDLDHGLELGNRSVDILARVQSSRAKDYVREFNTALAPWRRESAVREFIYRTRKELGVAA
jgi:hypothetical protein